MIRDSCLCLDFAVQFVCENNLYWRQTRHFGCVKKSDEFNSFAPEDVKLMPGKVCEVVEAIAGGPAL